MLWQEWLAELNSNATSKQQIHTHTLSLSIHIYIYIIHRAIYITITHVVAVVSKPVAWVWAFASNPCINFRIGITNDEGGG